MGKNRRLLVGSSSPIGYSYIDVKNNEIPNPVLESPVAYCLLYDELWFLTRSLCPADLVDLSFIHFVDEQYPSLRFPLDSFPAGQRGFLENWDWELWRNTADNAIGNHREFALDNHSRQVDLFGLKFMPSPGIKGNLIIDRFVASECDFELAENTPNHGQSEALEKNVLHSEVMQKLTAPRIASLRSPLGYWHPCLNELRAEPSLKAMRQKIGSIEPEEMVDVDATVQEINAEYRRQLSKSLDDRFSFVGFVKSSALFLIGMVPIVGNAVGAVDFVSSMVSSFQDRKKNYWTRFLCEVDNVGTAQNSQAKTRK